MTGTAGVRSFLPCSTVSHPRRRQFFCGSCLCCAAVNVTVGGEGMWGGGGVEFTAPLIISLEAGIAQSVQRLATGWMVWESNPVVGIRPDRPWHPHSLLYNGYQVSFSGLKRPARDVNHPPHLAPRSKKEQSCTSAPPLGLYVLL